jgi:acetyltransferase-like isoleucine patch superfamily enzyme
MASCTYRELQPLPRAEEKFLAWLSHLDAQFTQHASYESRSEIVREELRQIYLGNVLPGAQSPLAQQVVAESFDPRNVTLEPEYYGDVDPARYSVRKPLLWFWQMFDHSALGQNHWLGFRFRQMLGRHIFQHLGQNVKIFHNVEFSYGYNLTIEDNCVIHRNVLLDDRGGIVIREGSSISDYANVYSHTHDIHNQSDVTNLVTEIGPRARITYHATVLAGQKIGENAMLGTMGVATRPVPENTVSVGIPARPVKQKDVTLAHKG